VHLFLTDLDGKVSLSDFAKLDRFMPQTHKENQEGLGLFVMLFVF
jgi:hypothetical protein